ncbi:hypothetical protein D3C86_1787790 [compost metagenome]
MLPCAALRVLVDLLDVLLVRDEGPGGGDAVHGFIGLLQPDDICIAVGHVAQLMRCAFRRIGKSTCGQLICLAVHLQMGRAFNDIVEMLQLVAARCLHPSARGHFEQNLRKSGAPGGRGQDTNLG